PRSPSKITTPHCRRSFAILPKAWPGLLFGYSPIWKKARDYSQPCRGREGQFSTRFESPNRIAPGVGAAHAVSGANAYCVRGSFVLRPLTTHSFSYFHRTALLIRFSIGMVRRSRRLPTGGRARKLTFSAVNWVHPEPDFTS